jgi:hypothetical protein
MLDRLCGYAKVWRESSARKFHVDRRQEAHTS